MPRKPEPNVWQRDAAEYFRPSYNRDAGRILYGEHDVEHWYVVPGQAADGALVALGYESEPVTNPILVKWIDVLMTFDDRERRDKTPLIALLDSDVELPPIVCKWLADLLRRYQLTPKGRGHPTAYEYRVFSDEAEHLEDLVAQRHQLARMIERYDFTQPGRYPIPAYDMNEQIVQLLIGKEKATEYRKQHSGTIKAAAAIVAHKMFPSDAKFASALTLHCRGKHRAARQAERQANQSADGL